MTTNWITCQTCSRVNPEGGSQFHETWCSLVKGLEARVGELQSAHEALAAEVRVLSTQVQALSFGASK